ncbi:hypothetical protein [Nonomuraea sp. B5E05]
METLYVGLRVADLKRSPPFDEAAGSVPRTPITVLDLPDERGACDG